MSASPLAESVRAAGRRIRHDCAAVAEGTLTRVVGMTLEATGVNCALGQRCLILAPSVPARLARNAPSCASSAPAMP